MSLGIAISSGFLLVFLDQPSLFHMRSLAELKVPKSLVVLVENNVSVGLTLTPSLGVFRNANKAR